MRNIKHLSIALLTLSVSACTTNLSDEDRALLANHTYAVQQAQVASQQASQQAYGAAQVAETASRRAAYDAARPRVTGRRVERVVTQTVP